MNNIAVGMARSRKEQGWKGKRTEAFFLRRNATHHPLGYRLKGQEKIGVCAGLDFA